MDEQVRGPSSSGSVVLDLGAGVGALVVYAPPELDGRELEVARLGSTPVYRGHSRVRPRKTGNQTQFAAVYPQLVAGTYTVSAPGAGPGLTVTVSGGQVTTAWWPGTQPHR